MFCKALAQPSDLESEKEILLTEVYSEKTRNARVAL